MKRKVSELRPALVLGRNGDNAGLQASIRKHGLQQPLVVSKATKRVIIGERRRRTLPRNTEVPVVEVNVDAVGEMALRVSEEFTKRDAGPMEKTQALMKLRDALAKQLGRQPTQQELADLVGTTRNSIKDFIALSELPEPVKRMVARPAGHEGKQAVTIGRQTASNIARAVSTKRITGRQAEKVAKKFATGKAPGGRQSDEVVRWATDKSVPEPARDALLNNPGTSYEDAQRYAERLKEKARRDEYDAGLPLRPFLRQVKRRLRDWTNGLRQILDLASLAEGKDREDLLHYATRARAMLDEFIERLEYEHEVPTEAQVNRILAKQTFIEAELVR